MPSSSFQTLGRRLMVVSVAMLVAMAAVPCASAQAPAQERRVALTIDDGPVVGEMKDLANFQRIAAGLIDAVKAENVPAVIFINERQINVQGQRDARAEVLAQWLDAGAELANHTYSHPSLNKVPLRQFEDDLIRGEVILRPLIQERGKKLVWFRYPYLDAGASPEVHQGIVDFLAEHQYRASPITVDYRDFSFSGIYIRMLRSGNAELAEKVKQAYLDQLDAGFEYAEKASMFLYGYELPQVLLIHCNELNSLTLRDSIARIRKRGYSFVTLEEAMKDPAYQRPDTFAGPAGSWFDRTAATMGKELPGSEPRMPQWITELPRQPR